MGPTNSKQFNKYIPREIERGRERIKETERERETEREGEREGVRKKREAILITTPYSFSMNMSRKNIGALR